MNSVADKSERKSLPPFTVVLTGGIASGKSTISDKFESLGVPVIDTDVIARSVIEPGTPALRKIVSVFGRDFLNPEGSLDREKMRKLVFANPASRELLESIIHPAIADNVSLQLKEIDYIYCMLVIPLFAESSDYRWVNRVLLIDVPEEIQVQRVMERDNIDLAKAEAILKAQASRKERLSLADDVIVNTGSIDELDSSVAELHEKYLFLAEAKVS